MMVKHYFRLIALLAVLMIGAGRVTATDVTVNAAQIPLANITGLQGDVTGTATVTNGLTTITLTSNFRNSWIGVSGYMINLPAGDFYVSATASGGAVTLSTAYTGSSGSVAYRVYPFIFLRLYANRSYTPLGKGYVIQPGAPGSSAWYVNKAASVKSGQVYLPEMVLDATTDAVNPAEQLTRLSAFFYRENGSLISVYSCFDSFRLPPSTPTSWTALCSFNQTQTPNPPDNSVYTATQINSFLPVCTTNQIAYYSSGGRVLSCLTVGSGLQITSSTLSATGGGGGGSSVWSDLTAPVANLSINHAAYSTLFTWSNNTGSNNLFALETGTNDMGTGYLAQFSTPGGGNTKAPLRVSAMSGESLIVAASGRVGVGVASPVTQLQVLAGATNIAAGRFNVPSGSTSDVLQLQNNGTNIIRFAANGSTVDSVFGNATLAQGASAGFLYAPAIADAPSGTPTGYTGTVALAVDITNNRLYGYNGAWVNLSGSGGGGGGSTVWSDLTAPTGNLALSMAARTTAFTWNSATGSNSLFSYATGNNDTGTNYLVSISTPGASNAKSPLRVLARGGNALTVDEVGWVGFGTDSPLTQVELVTTNGEGLALSGYGADPALNAVQLQLQRARGGRGSETVPSSGDQISDILFNIWDGSGFVNAASIQATVGAAAGANDAPGQLAIRTTPDGSITPATRILIGPDGRVGMPSLVTDTRLAVTGSANADNLIVVTTNASTATGDIFRATHNSLNAVRVVAVNGGAVNSVFGAAALGTSATDGFVWLPTTTDTPAGTPTTYTGTAPVVFENDTGAGQYKLWAYLNGQWRDMSGGGGSSVWSALTSPTANLSLDMQTYTTSFAWDTLSGSANLFTFTTTSGDTGTNYLVSIETPGTTTKSALRVQQNGENTLVVDPDGDVALGSATASAYLGITKTRTSTTPQPLIAGAYTIQNSSAVSSTQPAYSFLLTDTSAANYESLIVNRNRYVRSATATGNPTLTYNIINQVSSAIDNNHTQVLYGYLSAGPEVASGKTLAQYVSYYASAPSGAGTTTTAYAFTSEANAGSSGFGTVAPGAMVHVLSNAAAKIGLLVNTAGGATADIATFQFNGTSKVRFDPVSSAVNYVFGDAALDVAATDGFIYVPSALGAPVGTPTSYTGVVPLIVRNEAANYKLYAYMGGNWRDLSGGAGGSTAWSDLTNPAGNLSLSMGTNTTSFSSATGSGASNLWTFTSANDASGTGYLVSITTPGTTNGLQPFRVQANGGESFHILDDGSIGIGTSSPAVGNLVELSDDGAYNLALYTANSGGATIQFNASRGTIALPSNIQSGDVLGSVVFKGYAGGVDSEGAVILSQVDGTPGTSDMPGRLGFYTTPDGADVAVIRQVIKNDGTIGFPTAVGNVHIAALASSDSNQVLRLTTNSATATADILALYHDSAARVRFIPTTGVNTAAAAVNVVNSVFGSVALDQTTTGGFVYIPTVDATPTGIPTAYTGTVAIAYNTANNHLYGYNAGWQDLTGSGGGSTAWSALTAPSGNLSLSMGTNTTSFSWATGSSTSNLFTFTSASDATGTGYLVSITSPGTTNALNPFRVQANGGESFHILSDGSIGIGTDTPIIGNLVELSANANYQLALYAANNAGAGIQFNASRGTRASPSNIQSGDVLGTVAFRGYAGGVDSEGAVILAQVDGTPGASDMPGVLRFYTTADGAAVGTLRQEIKNDGRTGFPSSVAAVHLAVTSQSDSNIGLRVGSNSTSASAAVLALQHGGTTAVNFLGGSAVTKIDSVFGNGALSSSDDYGFVFLPTMTDAPGAGNVPQTTGSYSGMGALVLESDTVNGQYNLYGYLNGGWRNLTGTGGGSTAWSALTNPSGNLALSHASNTTSMSWGATTGSNNLWTFTNTSNDTGTNYLVSVETPGASNAKQPFRVVARGVNALMIDEVGAVTIGKSEIANLSASETLIVPGDTASGTQMAIVQANSSSSTQSGATFGTYRALNTLGTPQVMVSGYTMGRWNSYGYDGSNYQLAASIRTAVDGTPGASDMPGRIVFSTTADGASTPTDRMIIKESGFVGIGTSTPAALFHALASTSTTNAAVQATQYGVNSTGTAAAGFGGYASYTAESSSTDDREAMRLQWWWHTATDGSRGAAASIQTVSNATGPTPRLVIAPRKSLTDDTVGDLADMTIASGTGVGGTVEATIIVTSGSNVQSYTAVVRFEGVNSSGTVTANATVVSESSTTSSGSLTASWFFTAGSGKATLQVAPASTLTSTTIFCLFTIRSNSEQATTLL